MKCPVCGAVDLVNDTRDIPYTYKGETTHMPSITGQFCPACTEVVLDMTTAERYGQLIKSFHKQVNAAIVDPNFIIDVRKKLQLGQKEAGDIFGGGVNAFSRYENGKTKPPLALIKLLRVLDNHPELLPEVI